MSRYYQMDIEIDDGDPAKFDKIKEAIGHVWSIDDEDTWRPAKNRIDFWGKDYLCGGESEDEFASRVTREIWEANGAYCCVVVNATYLEELPYETYHDGEHEYNEWLQKKAS